jgi:hypothetical protein
MIAGCAWRKKTAEQTTGTFLRMLEFCPQKIRQAVAADNVKEKQ